MPLIDLTLVDEDGHRDIFNTLVQTDQIEMISMAEIQNGYGNSRVSCTKITFASGRTIHVSQLPDDIKDKEQKALKGDLLPSGY